MKYVKTLFPAIFILMVSFAQAQDTTRTFTVSFAPQYLAMNAMRIDIANNFPNSLNRFTISPYYYAGTTTQYADQRNIQNLSPEEDRDEIFGWGLELMHKIYFRSIYAKPSFYFGYGAGYHYIDFEYKGQQLVEGSNEFEEPVYTEEVTDIYEHIDRVDVILLIGMRDIVQDFLTYEFFFGPVIKKSFIKSEENREPRFYGSAIQGHGYSGPTLRFGATIGVLLR